MKTRASGAFNYFMLLKETNLIFHFPLVFRYLELFGGEGGEGGNDLSIIHVLQCLKTFETRSSCLCQLGDKADD